MFDQVKAIALCGQPEEENNDKQAVNQYEEQEP